MTALRPTFIALAASLPLAVACSAAPGDGAASSASAVSSDTRTYLVPTNDDARVLCRAEVDQAYCDDAATDGAVEQCLAKLDAAGGSGGLRAESVAETCAASGPIYPDAASCLAPVPRNCAFYSACVDRQTPCGEDGYALGYGEKYCTAFKNVTTFTPAGVAWRDSVLHCLQVALEDYTQPSSAATCDEIMNAAFDSHPRCYTQPEHSICFLPPSDVLSVLGTIGGQELLAARSRKQIATTIATCVEQIGSWLFATTGAPLDERARAAGLLHPEIVGDDGALRAQHAMWTKLAADYAE